jgi:hypothetical protein
MVERIYEPVHNIGHFRCLEASKLDEQGQPTGEITYWDQIQFPFDPALRDAEDLASIPVRPLTHSQDLRIHEQYLCDGGGNLRVRISAEPAGFAREFTIAQPAKG